MNAENILREIVKKAYLRPGAHEDCQVHPDLIEKARAFLSTQQSETLGRFVMVVGSMEERLREAGDKAIPRFAPGEMPIWDRQEEEYVLTVHQKYAQLICLEQTLTPHGAPFTNLEKWLNELGAEALESENIPAGKGKFETCPHGETKGKCGCGYPYGKVAKKLEAICEDVASQLRLWGLSARCEETPSRVEIDAANQTTWVWGTTNGKWEGQLHADSATIIKTVDIATPARETDAKAIAHSIVMGIVGDTMCKEAGAE